MEKPHLFSASSLCKTVTTETERGQPRGGNREGHKEVVLKWQAKAEDAKKLLKHRITAKPIGG